MTQSSRPGVWPPVSPQFGVAGVAGGVGATTVTALLALAVQTRIGHPARVVDHSGGDLVRRIDSSAPGVPYCVYDLGTHTGTVLEMARSGVRPIMVTTIDPICLDASARTVAPLTGPPGRVARAVIVVNATAPRQRPAGFAATLRAAVPGIAVVCLEWDAALAMPGVIEASRLSAASMQMVVNVFQCFGV